MCKKHYINSYVCLPSSKPSLQGSTFTFFFFFGWLYLFLFWPFTFGNNTSLCFSETLHCFIEQGQHKFTTLNTIIDNDLWNYNDNYYTMQKVEYWNMFENISITLVCYLYILWVRKRSDQAISIAVEFFHFVTSSCISTILCFDFLQQMIKWFA